MKKQAKKDAWISAKIGKIMVDGVRRNTHLPYNPETNPRRPVTSKVASAIAESMYMRRKKLPKA